MSKELQRIDEINDVRIKLDNFNKTLDKKPTNVKTNRMAGNSKYVPIEQIENDLDKYFQVWNWIITDTKVMANAVIVIGTLEVLNPVTLTMVKRSGVGAVPIQVKSGANPTDFESINPTALQKNVPAANAYALKNAVKTLGDMFGRNLNREDVPFIPIHSTKAKKEEEKNRLMEWMIANDKEVSDLTEEQLKIYNS